MRVILSHVNVDFDGLASMVAASVLYPDAAIILTDKQQAAVRQYLAIYRDHIAFLDPKRVTWTEVSTIIIVDVATRSRIGGLPSDIPIEEKELVIIDHHPIKENDLMGSKKTVELVGAAVTLLVEEIQNKHLHITSFQATLFGLGIYTDTGSLSYSNTTTRDVRAVAYLMEKGMNLHIINRFSEQTLLSNQKKILQSLLKEAKEFDMGGLQITLSSYQQDEYDSGLSTLTRKLLEMTHSDAVVIVVKMQKNVYLIGRSSSDRINLLPLIYRFHGGGHAKAASATIKKGNLQQIVTEVESNLSNIIQPALTAKEMMSSPVKTISSDISIDEAAQMLYRFGHSGLPVTEEDKLVGIISRRDIDKAAHHGLGHAPVKAYMSQKPVCISFTASLEEIQGLMIQHNIGRLPVMHEGSLVGIVSRTDVIEVLHKEFQRDSNLLEQMTQSLTQEVSNSLESIGRCGASLGFPTYLIGGIVRDILLNRINEDIDIVVEADAIIFGRYLQQKYGGELKTHEIFKTATWTTRTGLKVDLTTSRTEYYDHPAALPTIAQSNLREDLFRRDFSINAMAISLHPDTYGNLIDPYRGRDDIVQKNIRILHNLSFVEDPTRVLRGIRFEKRFGFQMHPDTEKLAKTAMKHLSSLSNVRIAQECKKLFQEGYAAEATIRLLELNFWKQLHASSKPDILSSQAYKLQKLEKRFPDSEYWFGFMVLPFHKQENWKRIVSRYILSAKDNHYICEIDTLVLPDAPSLGELHRLLHQTSTEAVLFKLATSIVENEELILRYLSQRGYIPKLISGSDLLSMHVKPGPIFTEIILEIEIAYLDQRVQSKQEAVDFIYKHFAI